MPSAGLKTGLGEAARYQDASMPARQIDGAPAGLRLPGARAFTSASGWRIWQH